MALRDLVARFRINFDRSALDAANAKILQTKQALTQVDALTTLRPIALPTGALEAGAATMAQVRGQLEALRGTAASLAATRAHVRVALDPAALATFRQQAGQARAELDVVRQSIANLTSAGAGGSPQVVELTRQARALEVELARTSGAVARTANIATTSLSAEFRALTAEAANAASPAEAVRARFQTAFADASARVQGLRASLDALRAADHRSPRIAAMAAGLQQVETEATQARAALQQIGVQAVATAAEMRAIPRVSLISRTADALRKQLAGVQQQARAAAGSMTGVAAAGAAGAGAGNIMGNAMGFLKSSIMGVVAAAGIGLAGSFISDTLTAADEVAKLSATLGIAIDDLQVWQAFAATSGATAADLTTTVRSLTKNMLTATQTATSPAAKAFKQLGVDILDSDGRMRDVSDLLLETGGALGEMTNKTEALALVQVTLGRSGAKLLPGFKNGTLAAKEQLDMLRQLAVVYDDEFAANVEVANDRMYLAGLQLQKFRAQAVNFFLPIFSEMAAAIAPMLSRLAAFTKQTDAVGKSLKALAFAGALRMLRALAARLGGMIGLLRTAARFVLRFLLPFLILDDIITFLRGGESAIGALIDKLFGAGSADEFRKTIVDGLNGMIAKVQEFWGMFSRDEQAQADVKGATDEMWETLRAHAYAAVGLGAIMWGGLIGDQGMIDKGKDMFGEFAAWVREIISLLGEAAAIAWDDFWGGLVSAGESAIAWVEGLISGLVDRISGLGSAISDSIGGAIKSIPGAEALVKLTGGQEPRADVAQARTQNFNITDNSTFSSSISGVAAADIGSTLRDEGKRTRAALGKSRSATLRQLGGTL